MLRPHVTIVNDNYLPIPYATEIVCTECNQRIAIPAQSGNIIEDGVGTHDANALSMLAECFLAIRHTKGCAAYNSYRQLIKVIDNEEIPDKAKNP